MSKELEALNYLVNLAAVGNKEKHHGKIFESEEIVIKAIKRNEPMKVLLKDWKCGYHFYCPSCQTLVGFGNSVRESLTWNYCPHCGQKLDWRDKNDKSK